MPRRRPDSSASARRRFASAPPPIDCWPASPLVTATNLTAAPRARNFAAVPAARMSQSSGCAPNAITCSGASCASSAAAGSIARQNRSRSDITELILPDGLAFFVNRRAAKDREQRADGGTFGDVFNLAVLDAGEKRFDGVVGDIARRGYGFGILALVMYHAGARGFEDALRPGELFTHAREAGRTHLVGFVIDVNAVGEFESEREMVEDLHGSAYFRAAHADGPDRPGIQEP